MSSIIIADVVDQFLQGYIDLCFHLLRERLDRKRWRQTSLYRHWRNQLDRVCARSIFV